MLPRGNLTTYNAFSSLCWQARRGSQQHWASEASPMLRRDCERSEHVASYEIETCHTVIYNCQENAIFPFLRCPKIHLKIRI